mmetsp:Transcript_44677/g.95070  ORF Transcript_44677/g.95070 Transcript_44677/m.95070 type:complete len:295 (-) Transcript_44677:81-965(-)
MSSAVPVIPIAHPLSRLHGVLLVVLPLLLLVVAASAGVPPLQLQPIQVRLQLLPLDQLVLVIPPHHRDAPVLLRQLPVPGDAPDQRPQRVHDQLVPPAPGKGPVVLLQVRPPRLGSRPDGRGVALVHVPGRAGLVHVRPVLVEARQEQPHAVGPPHVGLGGALVPVGEVGREPPRGHGRAVDVLVVEALVPHPLGEGARVGGEAGDAHGDVIVDLEYLLLVGGQLGHGALERADDRVGVGAEGDARGSLLHGLHGVLHLEEAALRRPHRHVGIVHVAKHLGRSYVFLSIKLLAE